MGVEGVAQGSSPRPELICVGTHHFTVVGVAHKIGNGRQQNPFILSHNTLHVSFLPGQKNLPKYPGCS